MRKINRKTLAGSVLALVVMLTLVLVVNVAEVAAQATSTPTAASTTAAGTTAAATTAAVTTTTAATTAVATTAAVTTTGTTPAVTTATGTTPVATTATGTTAVATTATGTTAVTVTIAPITVGAKGANTGLPIYTPAKSIEFNKQFNDNAVAAAKRAAGSTLDNAKLDYFLTTSGEAQVVAFYDAQMQTLGFTRSTKQSLPQESLGGAAVQVYVYSKGQDAYAVAIFGPISATLLQTLAPAVVRANPAPAAGDSLVTVFSGIRLPAQGGGTQPPASGMGGATSSEGLNPLWLIVLLALAGGMATLALVTRRRRIGR